jgi:hypothetical protein
MVSRLVIAQLGFGHSRSIHERVVNNAGLDAAIMRRGLTDRSRTGRVRELVPVSRGTLLEKFEFFLVKRGLV